MTDALQITVQELMQLLVAQSTKVLLVDVRNSKEYALGHLPGAVLIPLPELQSGSGLSFLKSLYQRHQTPQCQVQVVVYCTAGVRSAQATHLLQQAGIPALNLQNGLRAWEERYITLSTSNPHRLQLVFQH